MSGSTADKPEPTIQMDPGGHVLVVDDDTQVRQLIGRFLREHGYRVTGARDGPEMLECLASLAIDLIILDLMLPGIQGLELCRVVRKGSSVPIIMVTAIGDETDRIVGLELGADDYIPKPFNPRELLARVRAVLRRARAAPATMTADGGGWMIRFAGWTVDTRRRELTSADGAVIDLSGAEYDLLLALSEHPNRVLSRERLLDLARNRMPGPIDRSVDVLISRLRRKLEARKGAAPLIKTVRGTGYMFLPKVERW